MKALLTTLLLFYGTMCQAQKVGGLFKYATMYTSLFASTPMEAPTEYFVSQDGTLMDITRQNPIDYKATIGIRRVARYDYENKQNRFYDGQTESTTALSATVGSVRGIEYLAQYESGRQQSRDYINQRYFLRYLSKYLILKGEFFRQGLVDLNYSQVEARIRLHIGEVDFSIGAAGRQHRPYGYNPIAIYLQDKQWWELAYEYGYEDRAYGIDEDFDDVRDRVDYIWYDIDGNKVADTDGDFRKHIYGNIVNDYNRSMYSLVGPLYSLSAIAGLDYYHYEEKFWLHAWASVLPWHQHIYGDHMFSYEKLADNLDNTNHWIDGQWIDYNAGMVLGYKLGKRWGIFTEAEYMQYWDRNIFNLRAGINYQIR